MNLSYRLLELPLEFTFAISRSSKDVAYTVLVELTTEYNGQRYTGLGEAVPTRFYGEDPNTVMDFYEQIKVEGLLEGLDPFNIQDLCERFTGYTRHRAARAAIDMAVYDIQGKILGIPLYQLWGLDPNRAPKTSYTIGLAGLETVRHKTEVALSRGYDILKVKLGGPEDLKTLALIRQLAPEATIRADANAAWTLDDALRMLPELVRFGVEFVEEPLHLKKSKEADYERLREETPLPLMADESCHTLRDIPRCAAFFHSVNLKPTKTGGLTEALRMIHAARAHDLKIMLGCFTETSVSNTAFAHLSPLVDYADLDGGLLLANDPFDGVKFVGNQIRLPQRPGIGVRPKEAPINESTPLLECTEAP
jgi:L-alanine-DL-glutamate epimerase-like enolase superfamily enzyme